MIHSVFDPIGLTILLLIKHKLVRYISDALCVSDLSYPIVTIFRISSVSLISKQLIDNNNNNK
uniref:7TM_GPCR_Srx domain-containing protein n=1 Tax=Heterorhabditis bacteriophora TaxID=37862 RepID=A0A1I7XBM9_HETBA